MKDKSDRQYFYRTLVSLAVPVTVQNAITSSLNLVDTIMIGQLGTVQDGIVQGGTGQDGIVQGGTVQGDTSQGCSDQGGTD